MKNPFRNIDEIERALGDITVAITRTRFIHFAAVPGWQPAINAFRCGHQFIICVELAGVEKAAIQVEAQARQLVIRGSRATPEPACDDSPAVQVIALEIDHGRFERVVNLPAEIEPERVVAEHRNGLLWIKLPLRLEG